MSQPLIGRFDERGGTLGRSDTVTFTLPDPERGISRVQAQILHRDEGYWIENLSAAIPLLHNGRPLSAGMRVLVREGDELRIGGYTLRATFEGDETSATILRGRTVITHLNGAAGSVTKGAATTGPIPTPSASVATEVSSDDLWRGFLQGAGITTPQPTRVSADLLGTIGSMLKIAIEGLYRAGRHACAGQGRPASPDDHDSGA